MSSSTKKPDRFGIVVWTLFAGLFVYAGIEKYGALLAYLKVSSYLGLFLTAIISYKLNKKLDEKIRSRQETRYTTWKRLMFMKSALTYGVFAALIYVFLFVQPDKLAIAYIKGIPLEALYPCSNQPLSPEVERIAREIFGLREIDEFAQDYCSTE